jgi:peptide/nickel transport system permease protein
VTAVSNVQPEPGMLELSSLAAAPHVDRWRLIRNASATASGRVGFGLIALVTVVALIGPLVSPHSPTEVVGAPFQGPEGGHLLGTDFLGRDGLSRFLHGGRTLLLVTVLSTGLAYLLGVTVGMLVGLRRGALDLGAVAVIDVLLSIPPIIFVLVMLGAAGTSVAVATLGIAIVFAPRIARIVRTVALEIATREFVEAAVARGEGVVSILRRDLLPNVGAAVMADLGIRVSGTIILFSSLSYLGLGEAPPAANWGLMISENRIGLITQPTIVIVPAITIALLAIGVNLLADAVARGLGKSVVVRDA